MKTPIYDFVNEYCRKNAVRFHMPGHKGLDTDLNVEHLDITEIDGAGNLWDPDDDIISESEANASYLFGCPTFYSVEGSSLAIRGMLFLIKKWAYIHGVKPCILAGRNAHKTFVNTAAILGIEVDYICAENTDSYMSCNLTSDDIRNRLERKTNWKEAVDLTDTKSSKSNADGKYIADENVRAADNIAAANETFTSDKYTAVYITSPDYLGNITDIEGIANVCHEKGVFLMVDNAHGAYLRFLEKSSHPIDLGADMCCDSAHKTLPALTGAAYLHVSDKTDEFFINNAKNAMEMFGSTSPSYLIMLSLDLCNKYLSEGFTKDLKKICIMCNDCKKKLIDAGYSFTGDESIKLTLDAKAYGYSGNEIADILKTDDIYPEHADEDYVVFMVSAATSEDDLPRLYDSLKRLPRKTSLRITSTSAKKEEKTENVLLEKTQKETKSGMSAYEAMMSDSELIPAFEAVGRTLSEPVISCPPCVPEYMAGERMLTIPKGREYVRVVKKNISDDQ